MMATVPGRPGRTLRRVKFGALRGPVDEWAQPAGDDGGVALHLVHRYLAAATLLLLGLAGLRALARPATRRAAAVLLVLLGGQFALGVLTVLGGFGLWLAIAHSVGAALLLAAAMQLLAHSRR